MIGWVTDTSSNLGGKNKIFYQLDCSPSLQTEPQLRLEAAKSTTGKLIVVVVHPHTIKLTSSRDVARRRTT